MDIINIGILLDYYGTLISPTEYLESLPIKVDFQLLDVLHKNIKSELYKGKTQKNLIAIYDIIYFKLNPVTVINKFGLINFQSGKLMLFSIAYYIEDYETFNDFTMYILKQDFISLEPTWILIYVDENGISIQEKSYEKPDFIPGNFEKIWYTFGVTHTDYIQYIEMISSNRIQKE